MKKVLFILLAFIGLCTSVNAQNYGDNIRVEWRKDGLYGTAPVGGYPAYVNITNNNGFDVNVYVVVTAVSMADGEEKTFAESFRIKANSNKTTTPGKYAVINTNWYRGVVVEKSSIEIRSCTR